jgi:hypothetical protein
MNNSNILKYIRKIVIDNFNIYCIINSKSSFIHRKKTKTYLKKILNIYAFYLED